MNALISAWQGVPEYTALLQALKHGRLPAAVSGVSYIHKVHLTACLQQMTGRRMVILASDEGEAARMTEDLRSLGQTALHYPARDFTFRDLEGYSREYEHARISVLCRALGGDYTAIVTTADALEQFIPPPEILMNNMLTLRPGQTITPTDLLKKLVGAGYVRAAQVEGPGQFASRGGILDIFSPDNPAPFRLEFWGDEIDCIAEFDVRSQRRGENLKSVTISQAVEVPADPADVARKAEMFVKTLHGAKYGKVKAQLTADIARLRDGVHFPSYDRFLRLIYPTPATLFDYAEDAVLFVSEAAKVREHARTFEWRTGEELQGLYEDGYTCRGMDGYICDYVDLLKIMERFGAVFLDAFPHSGYDLHIKELITFRLRSLSSWSGSLEILKEDLLPALEQNYRCVVLAGTARAAENLATDLNHAKISAHYEESADAFPAGQVTVMPGGLSAGFDYPDGHFLLVSHGRAAGTVRRRRRKKNVGEQLNSLDQLKPGDYVVHASHGIGVFEGIEKKQVQGITKDYIKIRYAKGDLLYLPVTQLDLVSKYIGPKENGAVKVNRLGGAEWQKARSRVKAAAKDMAKELIELYSKRMNQKGFAFSGENEMQLDFERRFEYDETEDQLRCIEEIKADMQKPVPMERLLCGDVGFGKTEVALRAAFKCILNGKQCALLVPTTILAWQHFGTIKQRMEGLPVNVELLSRFRSPGQQRDIIKNLRRGNIDMVVGTHRLVSKDVTFRDLGLVIVDEEQRFGVAQKEKLKELLPTVDVLTLSATPIPRTLNMAMSGLRDMSVLEEAPQDRQPVQTYVLEYDGGILNDAIRREIRRGGQVYYLHNRVETIEKVAMRLQTALPEAAIGVAHGKMGEEEISDVWKKLLDHEIDLLVCTTIIETGVDVPNVNTLIIEDSDKMGLSQLHQLRGRVGRSARRAYAYLTFRRGRILSEVAHKRLEAIREFTEFGSGFKIAMRDLEIRGAGNILGAQQHGHMETVGYDMYLKLLSEAVSEEKGEKPAQESECTVDLQIEAHIPEDYIQSLQQRLGIYRRIADIRTNEDSMDVQDELTDRFGEPPDSVRGLIDVAMLRNQAAGNGIYEISQKQDSLLLYPRHVDMQMVSKLAGAMKGRVMLSAGSKPYIAVKSKSGAIDALREIIGHLSTDE
ncbi:MAG TPA: transcription-repair coupling factor [Ruminococcaceae bacterium]|nr:transcription-repair coupling factor [Oscillospiraceae bacterium]